MEVYLCSCWSNKASDYTNVIAVCESIEVCESECVKHFKKYNSKWEGGVTIVNVYYDEELNHNNIVIQWYFNNDKKYLQEKKIHITKYDLIS